MHTCTDDSNKLLEKNQNKTCRNGEWITSPLLMWQLALGTYCQSSCYCPPNEQPGEALGFLKKPACFF